MKEDNDSSWRENSAQDFKLQVLSLVTGEFQTVLLFVRALADYCER